MKHVSLNRIHDYADKLVPEWFHVTCVGWRTKPSRVSGADESSSIEIQITSRVVAGTTGNAYRSIKQAVLEMRKRIEADPESPIAKIEDEIVIAISEDGKTLFASLIVLTPELVEVSEVGILRRRVAILEDACRTVLASEYFAVLVDALNTSTTKNTET